MQHIQMKGKVWQYDNTITDSKNLLFPWLLMIFDSEISQHNLLWKLEFCGFLLASNIDLWGIMVIYMQRASDVS